MEFKFHLLMKKYLKVKTLNGLKYIGFSAGNYEFKKRLLSQKEYNKIRPDAPAKQNTAF